MNEFEPSLTVRLRLIERELKLWTRMWLFDAFLAFVIACVLGAYEHPWYGLTFLSLSVLLAGFGADAYLRRMLLPSLTLD